MPTYLIHPDHGTHIAYSEQEVERCKAHGWTIRPPKGSKPAEPLPAVAPIEAARTKRKYTKRVNHGNGV